MGIRWQAEQLLASLVWQVHEVKRPHSCSASEGRFPWRHTDGESCAGIPSSTSGGQIPTTQGLLDNNCPSVGQEFLPFMEHKSSFPCSQQHTTPRYRQPRASTETHSSLSMHFKMIPTCCTKPGITWVIYTGWFRKKVLEIKIKQNCNKTNSYLCLRNMGAERNRNLKTISLWEENSKKNIWAHKRKPNMESQNQWRIR